MSGDFSFITDRLAVGDVASRSTPGFVAVVSVLATERPGVICDELYGAPEIDDSVVVAPRKVHHFLYHDTTSIGKLPILHVDLADGEGAYLGPAHDRQGIAHTPHDLADYLDDVTTFIAAYIHRGCVLVHCGAGRSRSVAVVVAYLCRYAGMSYSEALSLVKARRPGAAPADCFKAAIERWLGLEKLSAMGPRR